MGKNKVCQTTEEGQSKWVGILNPVLGRVDVRKLTGFLIYISCIEPTQPYFCAKPHNRIMDELHPSRALIISGFFSPLPDYTYDVGITKSR